MPQFSDATLWFDRKALAEIDRRSVEEFHIPILTLMENAGTGVAHIVNRYAPPGETVFVICGPGNNGGDGLVAAPHLCNRGYHVQVLLTAPQEKYHDAAAVQLAIIQAMRLPVFSIADDPEAFNKMCAATPDAACMIDAIFGTGLSRPVEGTIHDLIVAVNAADRLIISVDIPSGLDCDSGQPLKIAIRAGHTVSFCGMKIGFSRDRAPAFTGQVSIADIGVPFSLLQELAIPVD